MLRIFFFALGLCISSQTAANAILVPMDQSQSNHLKAYGLAYFALEKGLEIDWLLNYRGGSFMIRWSASFQSECVVRGVSFEVVSDAGVNSLLKEIASPSVNMEIVRLERAPRVAVYSPKNDLIPDETDAVIVVLEYAEIPFELLYDEEILRGDLGKFDWLHLHHEDFTGQFGKHLRRETSKIEADVQQATARRLGFTKVSQMKLEVAKKIKGFCTGGGYLFAMCSGAETFDIALSAEGVDINDRDYDGDEPDPDAQSKLDFTKSLAFENFTIDPAYSRRFSDINTGRPDFFDRQTGYFQVFQFSAKWDLIPSLLTQNHTSTIKEFHGQTTAFARYVIKPAVTILAENRNHDNVRYIYGEVGRGHWTYYSGHDPEGSPGRWREPTDLNQHPHSPGYRLILNNVLFPSAKRKKMKT